MRKRCDLNFFRQLLPLVVPVIDILIHSKYGILRAWASEWLTVMTHDDTGMKLLSFPHSSVRMSSLVQGRGELKNVALHLLPVGSAHSIIFYADQLAACGESSGDLQWLEAVSGKSSSQGSSPSA